MKLALVALAVSIAAIPLIAQEHPSVTAQPNTVYVGADGKFESAPDTALIQFNISVQEDTSQAAYQHASKDVEQVRQVLHANGIEPKAAGSDRCLMKRPRPGRTCRRRRPMRRFLHGRLLLPVSRAQHLFFPKIFRRRLR